MILSDCNGRVRLPGSPESCFFSYGLHDGDQVLREESIRELAVLGKHMSDYIHGGVGKTTPDRFADIVVHHQIASAAKLAALYREYRERQSNYPAEMTQMRTRIRSLDFEVARLKPFEAEVGKLKDLLSAKAAEYDKLASQLTKKTGECSRLIVQQEETDAQLAKKLAQLDQVETRLADAEIQCTDLRGKLTAVEVQKEEAEAKLVSTEAQFSKLEAQLKAVETRLVVERKEAKEDFHQILHKMEEYRSRYDKLRKRYRHYKAKAARFFKQLSFTTWYRDQSWVKGFRWGFESFRTIALNPSIFKVDLKTVLAGYLPPPERATEELLDLGKDLFPDVPRWTDEQGPM